MSSAHNLTIDERRKAIPLSRWAVVAGEDATEGAIELAREDKVLVMHDGRRLFWDEALAVAPAN